MNLDKKKIGIILALAILVFAINPFGLDLNQGIVFSSLVFVIGMWATNGMNKDLACLILIVAFMVFGKTKPLEVINFLWSDTIFLIVTTNLLSIGIMKTGIIDRFWGGMLKRAGDSIVKLLLIPFIFGIVLIFVIPQAFARVIILGTIYNSIIVAKNEEETKAKKAIIFAGFMAITVTYMMFINGDIVLNQSAVNFSGQPVIEILNFGYWARLMALPTLLTSLIVIFVLYYAFKEDLKFFHKDMIKDFSKDIEISKSTRNFNLLLMLVVIGFWMTEGFLHDIPSYIPALLAVILMFANRTLVKKDISSINPHFLLFLTAAFSIGKVLGQAGITEKIFLVLEGIIPASDSSFYLITIAVVTMALHILIGSSVATMSVVLPIFIPMAINSGINPVFITLLVYIMVNIHFFMPYHHATLMIGAADGYYDSSHMIKMGSIMTILALLIVQFIYIPWWNIMI